MGEHSGAHPSGAICPRPTSPWWNRQPGFWSLKGREAGEHNSWKTRAGKSVKPRERPGGASQGFPDRVLAETDRGAADPLPGAARWKPYGEAGGCGAWT